MLNREKAIEIANEIGKKDDVDIWRWVQQNQDIVYWVAIWGRSTFVQINYDAYEEDFENSTSSVDLTEGTGFYLSHHIGGSEGVTTLLDAFGIRWIIDM